MTTSMTRRIFATTMALSLGSLAMPMLVGAQEAADDAQAEDAAEQPADQDGIDYMVLVNKQHELPKDWENKVQLVHFTNSEGWGGDVEAKTYDAYLALKEDLEADGVFIDLDSAYRSVAEQQEIVEDFTEKYGEEYVKQYVAVPGFSEHHTGLALDLFLIIDGKGVYYNEDMVQYPEIWEKVHAKLADHGFILRLLPGKKIETGYSYEPWHIRYLDDPEIAREIADAGITLERYLGEVDPMIADCEVDYGSSGVYTDADIDAALDVVLAEFLNWKGCTMTRIAFAGDEACGDDEVAYLNELREEGAPEFTQALVFTTDFHSPSAEEAKGTAWEPDADYSDYTWHLGRVDADSSWKLLTWGFC